MLLHFDVNKNNGKNMNKAKFQEYQDFFQVTLNKEDIFDLTKIFGNDNPVCLEIGCGKGEFIAQKSILHPDINFLGIDVKSNRLRATVSKLDIEKNSNVRLLRAFVDKEISQWFPKNKLERIYIIHPDPWPKKKHHKRRLIQQEFIDVLAILVKNGGYVEMATDHHEYAEWIVDNFSRRDDFKSIYENGYGFDPPQDHIETYFEKKKKMEGFEPHFMLFKQGAKDD